MNQLPTVELPTSSPNQPETQPARRPLLNRLVPSILNGDIDARQTQPQFGASVTVTVYGGVGRNKDPRTVWLPAAAWEGVATLIRQTPNHCRSAVGMFLTILEMNMAGDDPLQGVLKEVITEIESDPYGEMPADDHQSFDFHWA
jgi:hypothetical protein